MILPAHLSGARQREEERDFVTGRRSRERLSAARRGAISMPTFVQKITLPSSRNIPFTQLVLAQFNIGGVEAGRRG